MLAFIIKDNGLPIFKELECFRLCILLAFILYSRGEKFIDKLPGITVKHLTHCDLNKNIRKQTSYLIKI